MKKILTLIMMLVATLGIQAQDSWTVAGVSDLCGSFWDPADATNDMVSTDNVNFTLVKTGLILEGGVNYGFKVVANHSWDEAYPSNNYLLTVEENGMYTVTFKFNAETKAVDAEAVKTGEAVIPEKVWTIAGTEDLMGSNWDPTDAANDMTKQEDGTFKLVKDSVALLAATEYEFKVLANHSWTENYGAGGQADGQNCIITVDADGNYNITFTFDPETKALAATAVLAGEEDPVIIEVDTWTVVGEKALLGVSWDPTATNNDMTLDGNVYKLVKEGVMLTTNENGYGYKVVKNHAWDEAYPTEENALLPIAEDAEYKVTFTFDAETKEVSATAEKTGDYVAPVVGNQTWTVTGFPALCGTEWDPTDATNDMTASDGVNYTLVKEKLILEVGVGYGFKIVADHSWDEAYPADNYILTVEENGEYTVTFKFNKDTKEVGADAVKTGDAEIEEKTWTIAGSAAVLGSSWDQTDTANDMTKQEDGTFKLVKKGAKLIANIKYEFKVLADHSWSINYGQDGQSDGPNYIFTTDKDGEYEVTFTWNFDEKDMSVATQKTGDYTPTWTIVGDEALCGSFWASTDTINDMTTEDNVNFILVKKDCLLKADTEYRFVVYADHSYSASEFTALSVQEEGHYSVTFKFNRETLEVIAEAEKASSEPVAVVDTWTIAGVTALCGSDWDPADTANDMTMQADSTFVLVKENVTLVANTEYEFKVVGNHTWDINYGADGVAYGANCFFTVEAAGVYTVTFTWNYAKKELLATAERTGDIDFGDHLFVVAGSFNDWNLNEDYKMTLQENGLFTYTIESIQLDKNQVVEYKVVDIVDAENPVWHPEGSNLVFSAEKEGNYSITFAFDALTMQASATGERQVELHEYTAKWVNVERWDSVYAYAWTYNFETYETTFFMGEYPGKLIEKTSTTELYGEEFDVYTCTITSEFPPQNIIFSNGLPGDGNQTTDHAFVDGKVYSEVAPPVEVKMNAFGYMPFSSKLAMLITADMDIKAYYAAGNSSNGELQMVRFFGKAPARYGLFLVGEPNATYSIPTTFNTGGYPTNLMIGSVENTNVAASADGIYRYTFLTDEESAGFYEVGEEGAVSYAGMAYIESPYLFATNDSGEVRWNLFEDIETLGINATKDSTASHDTLFNLQGQRVGKSFRGIAVRNGKKIVVR